MQDKYSNKIEITLNRWMYHNISRDAAGLVEYVIETSGECHGDPNHR